MSSPKVTRQWVLQSPITGAPIVDGSSQEQTFRLESKTLPALKENQALIRLVYVSNDAGARLLLGNELHTLAVKGNEMMIAQGIWEVMESTAATLKPEMLVFSWVGWTEFAVINAEQARPLHALPGGLDITHHLGAFGPTGFTAYYGLLVIAEAKPSDVVVVSAAAGATGSMVVQIAKRMVGCKRVIGIAGGEKKCRWVEQYHGADVCVDYKSASFEEDLVRETGGANPDVNVYFDNVGGRILNLMLMRMAMSGRIASCGAISTYNASSDAELALKNWFQVFGVRLQIRGFMSMDYDDHTEEIVQYLSRGFKEGKLKIADENNDIVTAKFEDIPKVWMKLYEGGNSGKLITKLDSELKETGDGENVLDKKGLKD